MKSHSLITQESKQIFTALGKNNARFVGGAVRDSMLGKAVIDIDIATRLKPDETMRRLQAKGIRVIPTGLKHGTVTALIGKQSFEITTLRNDVACDGRHAEVAFTEDWQADAARRDFTMNAMFMDESGKHYDYFGGEKDLKAGRLTFIGDADARIQEDYLRILRLFRFHAYYGKIPIDKATLAACKTYAAKIKTLSGERIQAEMFKLLKAEKPDYAIAAMAECTVLEQVFAGLKKPNLEAFKFFSGKGRAALQYIHLIRLIALIPKANASVLIKKIAARWKLSNNYRDALLELSTLSTKISKDLSVAEQKKLCRNHMNDTFKAAVWTQYSRDMLNAKTYEKMIAFAETWTPPTFPLSGNDIIGLGIKSGKEVGVLLKKAEAAWEKSDYKLSKKELLSALKR